MAVVSSVLSNWKLDFDANTCESPSLDSSDTYCQPQSHAGFRLRTWECVLVTCGCHNNLSPVAWLFFQLQRSEIQDQNVSRAISFWRLWRRICSMPLLWLLMAVSNPCHSLACGCLYLHTTFSPVSYPLLRRTLIIGFRAHPVTPGWSDIYIFNSVTSAKTLFLNKVTFTGMTN